MTLVGMVRAALKSLEQLVPRIVEAVKRASVLGSCVSVMLVGVDPPVRPRIMVDVSHGTVSSVTTTASV